MKKIFLVGLLCWLMTPVVWAQGNPKQPATGAPQLAPGIGDSYGRFLEQFKPTDRVDGVDIYDYDEVVAAFASGSYLPFGATLEAFLDWFGTSTTRAWDETPSTDPPGGNPGENPGEGPDQGGETPPPGGVEPGPGGEPGEHPGMRAPLGDGWVMLMLCAAGYGAFLLRRRRRASLFLIPGSWFLVPCSLFSFLSAHAQEFSYEACMNAIEVKEGFQMRIEEPGYYFFTATTFDLPIALSFVPDNRYDRCPYGMGDFSCIPGEYDDPNLTLLVKDVQKWGYSMPLEFGFANIPTEDESMLYRMDVLTEYRDKMSLYGINYDVRAWIMVEFFGPGLLTTHQDNTFRDCLANSITFRERDTIEVMPTTAITQVHRFPIVEWLNDSVLFRWEGKEKLEIWLANECNFELDTKDPAVLYRFIIDPKQGADSLFLTSKDIYEISCMTGQTGVNYMRFKSKETADLHFVFNPAPTPENNALPIRIGQPVHLYTGLSPLYYFPVSWLEYADPMIWRTTAGDDTDMRLYLHTDGGLIVSNDYTNATSVYPFGMEGDYRALPWSMREVDALRFANDGVYYYLNFLTTESTDVTLWYWGDQSTVSECVADSKVLSPLDHKEIPASSSGQAYRLDVRQWLERDQDVLLTWEGRNKLTVWVMKTCKGNLKTSNVNYINSFLIDYAEGNNSRLLTHAELEQMMQYADEDGYIYIRFSVSSPGEVTCTPFPKSEDITFPPVMTSVDTINGDEQPTATKELRNGQLLIHRNGQTYNLQGQLWRE